VSVVEATVAAETEEFGAFSLQDAPAYIHEYLKVKFDGSTDWSRLNLGKISGFRFEDGNEYRLKIKKTELAVPPMDGSSVVYELVEIVSKTKKDQDVVQVQRFYVRDPHVIIIGEELTEKEKQEVETKVLADFPKPFFRTYKFIYNDEDAPVGNVVVYTNDKKGNGSFERLNSAEKGSGYRITIGDEEHEYYIIKYSKSVKSSSGTVYTFTEDLLDNYKNEYPKLQKLFVQQPISSTY